MMEHIIKTKFEVGDTVWTMQDNRPVQKTISRIVINRAEYERYLVNESALEYRTICKQGGFHYDFFGGSFGYDSNCFATKEELIESLYKEG